MENSHNCLRSNDDLAVFGGAPVRQRAWPRWPRADHSTERAVLDVLHSRRWTISGPYQGEQSRERRFSEAFATYNEVPYCVPVSSGTSSLTIALLALGIGAGDEVLTPGLTWVACASSIFCVGATPILVDIELSTLAMSIAAAEDSISSRTKAIMVVHPFCRLADIEGIVGLAEKYGLAIVEDCSQAHGARWNGRRVGTFGHIGCFSMQQSKVLTAGEGGAAITNDRQLYQAMEQLRCDGRMFAGSPRIGHLELVEVGQVQGQNFCLSEFQSAILLDRLPQLDTENQKREEQARLLTSLLAGIEGVLLLPEQPNARQTYYNFVVGFDTMGFGRNSIDALSLALSAELGIQIAPIYQPMNAHRLYNPLRSARTKGELKREELDPSRFHLPKAHVARSTFLSFPNYVLLDEERGLQEIAVAIEKIRRNCCQLRALSQEASTSAF